MKNKKLLVSYSNCQGGGILHFLRKTRMAEEFDFVQWNNWQVLMLEQPLEGLLADLERADVLIYQPCKGYQRTDGVSVPGVGDLIAQFVPDRAVRISFPYCYNHGFFPIIKLAPGLDGWITGKNVPAILRRGHPEWIRGYNSGEMRFDCARRFAECLAEQSMREIVCDVNVVPFILRSFQEHRLFLTQNHPTSSVFAFMAAEIISASRCGLDWEEAVMAMRTNNINEANMNGVLPVHPAAVEELGLNYPADDNSQGQYLKWFEEMAKEVK